MVRYRGNSAGVTNVAGEAFVVESRVTLQLLTMEARPVRRRRRLSVWPPAAHRLRRLGPWGRPLGQLRGQGGRSRECRRRGDSPSPWRFLRDVVKPMLETEMKGRETLSGAAGKGEKPCHGLWRWLRLRVDDQNQFMASPNLLCRLLSDTSSGRRTRSSTCLRRTSRWS